MRVGVHHNDRWYGSGVRQLRQLHQKYVPIRGADIGRYKASVRRRTTNPLCSVRQSAIPVVVLSEAAKIELSPALTSPPLPTITTCRFRWFFFIPYLEITIKLDYLLYLCYN